MAAIEGTLVKTPDGRWAISRGEEDKRPVDITSGDMFSVEVPKLNGQLKPTRMEFDGNGRTYYSVHGYTLAEGLKARMGGHS